MDIDLLSIEETAQLLKVTPNTLQHWRLKRSGPPFIRVGQRFVRYRRGDLQNWIDSQVQGAA